MKYYQLHFTTFENEYMKRISLFTFIVLLFISCTEEKIVNIEVEVDKKYSWEEVRGFSGSSKIFVGSGKSGDTVYFQQLNAHTQMFGNKVIKYWGFGGMADLSYIYPFNGGLTAVLNGETTLSICNLNGAGGLGSTANTLYMYLTELDQRFDYLQKPWNLNQLIAINESKQILFRYKLKGYDSTLSMMLVSFSTLPGDWKNIDTLSTKIITIGLENAVANSITYIGGFKNYFLVGFDQYDCLIYKVYTDGSYKLLDRCGSIRYVFEHLNRLYFLTDRGLFASDNDAETIYQVAELYGVDRTTKFRSIGDSIVGFNDDYLYTMNFNNNAVNFRLLKNDGLIDKGITGMEVLNDTVYVCTYSGLYKKPIKTFFESK